MLRLGDAEGHAGAVRLQHAERRARAPSRRPSRGSARTARAAWRRPRSRPSTTRSPHHSATAARCSSRRTWPQTSAPAAAASWQARCPTPPEAPSTSTLRPEQQPALAQRMQRGEPGDRQGRGLGVADRVGQRGDRMAAAIDPLGPGARRQDADDPRAGLRAAAVGRRGLDHPGEIPARPPARLGHLQGAPRLAAVQRDRGDPHADLVAVGVAQLDRLDRELPGRSRIDDNGADLSAALASPLFGVAQHRLARDDDLAGARSAAPD